VIAAGASFPVDQRVRIAVRDHGPGIPAAHIRKLGYDMLTRVP
jgi:hypothetical protein